MGQIFQINFEKAYKTEKAHSCQICIVSGIVLLHFLGRVFVPLQCAANLRHPEGFFVDSIENVSQDRGTYVYFEFPIRTQIFCVQ